MLAVTMRTLKGGIIIVVLLWLEFILFREANALRSAEIVDGTKVVMVFLSIIGITIVIGIIVAVMIVPAIGESIGSFFFNPNEEIEKDPHADAMAKIAQGDYEGAVEEYRIAIDKNQEDTHAISEVVHIYCDKMGDIDAAGKFLEQILEKEWPAEQGAFLASRLVDVYWNYKHDAEAARHSLQQIAETMPDTKYAANAIHRLHEIERALANEESGMGFLPRPAQPSAESGNADESDRSSGE
jgi:uncharacterized protein HemY